MLDGLLKRRVSLAAVFCAVIVVSSGSAEAAKRVALLIGNQDYQSTTALKNPANDVQLLRQTFLDAGFDSVEVALDLDLVAMRKTLRAFEDRAEGAEIAVLYYSGHGMEMNGENYLIPTDAVMRSDKDVEDEALPLDRVQRSLNGATKLKLVILDACRNNPFINTMTQSYGTRSVQRGLAKVEPRGADTLVAYASRAGTVALDGNGRNSPFATALSKYITQPGVDIRIAFGRVRDEVVKVTERKQEPFVYGSLGGSQIFLSIKELNVTINNPKVETKTEPKEQVSPNGISSAAADWQNIKDLADKELLEAFITKHGADPVYKMLAEKKLKLLAQAEAKADVSADQIAWEALKGSTDAAALKRFVERYPESRFRREAEAAMAKLGPVQSPEVSTLKDSPAARDCYLLAGEPQSLPGFAGVYMSRIDAKRALSACAQAVNENPSDGMLVNLLGRAHEADRNFKEARLAYEKAADLGDLYGLTNLGWFSIYGLDGEVDYAKGEELFQRGAKSGNHASQAALGFLYRNGLGVSQDYAEAIKWYRRAADQGNAAALGNLGWFYREGVGVEQDYVKSLDFYRKGAEAGDTASIAAMGYAAQNGLGMAKSNEEALKWYEKGANAGDDYSMASLGFLYDAGVGVKQDYVEARYWYEKAANSGNAYAMGNLSRLYDKGLGTPIDTPEAVRWAIAAVERGDKAKTRELKTQATNFSPAFRREFQRVLTERGFYDGPINGDFGAATNDAINRLISGETLKVEASKTEDLPGDAGTTSGETGASSTTITLTRPESTSIADAVTFRANDRSTTDKARECYDLAGEPGYSSDVKGMLFADINVSRTIAVCRQAIDLDRNDSMLYDMLGRAYDVDRNYELARSNYARAIEFGNIFAYTNLAWLHIYGNGQKADVDKGVRMLHRAAAADNPYAQASLGWIYREGYGGVKKDYHLAFEWYKRAADQNYANAQSSLGWLYREGLGVPRDAAKSLEYYRLGAEGGDVNAMGAVGYAYQNGLGTEVDFVEARKWYEMAVAKNDAYSMSALGWLYREGKGVEVDYTRALDLYHRAADMNDVTALSALGYMAQYGLGMEADLKQALNWYVLAAARDDAYANAALGWMYREGQGVVRDYKKSLSYYRRGAELGDLNAMGSMGYALQNGLGTPIKYSEARVWYEKAAKSDDAYSMGSLAWLYETGKGTRQDYLEARYWYEKAANAGNAYAMGNLAYLHDQGLGGRQDRSEAARLAISTLENGEPGFISEMKSGAGRFSPGFRMEVQRLLKRRGLYSGPIDGVFGTSTAGAFDRIANSRS